MEENLSKDSGSKPRPKNALEKFGLSPLFARAFMKAGYKSLTPVQRKTIPLVLASENVLAVSRTGSGKTAAFLLPLLQLLGTHSSIVGIRCLIFEPTRELAAQVYTVSKRFCMTNLRHALIVGGASIEKQFSILADNPDIVIACPGRFHHLLMETQLSLARVKHLVLDESDQMLELGLHEALSVIVNQLPPNRQNLLFSATLPTYLSDFTRVLGLSKALRFVQLDQDTTLSPTLKSWFISTRADEKAATLLFLLKSLLPDPNADHDMTSSKPSSQSILIFTASRFTADFLHLLISQTPLRSGVIYGSLDAEARNLTISHFRKQAIQILFATDVAARGLDLPHVDVVISYDFPTTLKYYVHRFGRTARAGREGTAISLMEPEDLAYALEISLSVGVDFTKTSEKSLGSAAPTVAVGCIPNLEEELEFIAEKLKAEEELLGAQKLSDKARGQYHKSRQNPSKESLRRAREILKSRLSLFHETHPAFKHHPRQSQLASKAHQLILDTLGSIRPATTMSTKTKKSFRRGGVLPPQAVEPMMKAKQDISQVLPQKKRVNFNLNSIERVFDWKQTASDHASQQFFLTALSSDAAKPLEESEIQLLPESVEDERRVAYARKWNKKHSKYALTPVDPKTGQSLRMKQVKRRNEAGQIIKGELPSQGLYKSWSKRSRDRIQNPGEAERRKLVHPQGASRKYINLHEESAASSHPRQSFRAKQSESLDQPAKNRFSKSMSGEAKGHLNKKAASHKSPISYGEPKTTKSEIRNAQQMMKYKKLALKKELKEKPGLRAQYLKKTKEKFLRKQANLAAQKGAAKRSFPLVYGNRLQSKRRKL